MNVVGDFFNKAVDEDIRSIDLILQDRELTVIFINSAGDGKETLADSLKNDDMVALFEMEF